MKLLSIVAALCLFANTGASAAEVESHWAFRPVTVSAVPSRFGKSRNPIDYFIAQKLTESRLAPSPGADRLTLIRRLYFVMLGVPPTPEEAAAFLANNRPDAFERLIDKTLADPRYGERWARHWLDVVRFAESNGFETNRERPNAWRFRDYVINAFNTDKPYDQFIREQLAGDALGADVATGFLVGGPVDIVTSPDPALTAQQRADELDDMVSTTGTAFLGLTLGCARCHSHKFDPISHREYYAMTALLSGVHHGERALPTPAAIARAPSLLPAVNAFKNEENVTPIDARYVRFTILATSGAEPCLDELEVWSLHGNAALATRGTKVTASGTLAGFAIHKLEHINDGLYGNSHSWISSESGRGWIQLEFPSVERIDRIVWSRDREGKFLDRLPIEYKIEAGLDPSRFQVVASSDNHEKPRKFPMAYAGTFSEPGPTYRLNRGNPLQPREEVSPGTLAIFEPLTLDTNAPEKERRLQLADWIARPENPLTARVLVNRIWQHHFGAGLVATPNDFGKNGAAPSHPELLDYLAHEFVANHWSVKNLQRLILTSATWQQSSAPRSEALALDGADRLLWRFPPQRLEAEAIRDSILAVSGNLNPSHGGPSFFLHNVNRENVYHYQPKENFGPAETRRMIYAFKVRMEQDGIFGAFDCPDGSLVTPKRSLSTTPLQALNLFNSAFAQQQSAIFAARLKQEASDDSFTQIHRAWHIAYNRSPTQDEARDAFTLVESEGLPALCRALLNSNEFLFIP